MREFINILCLYAGCSGPLELAVKVFTKMVIDTIAVMCKAALATATIVYVARYLKVFWI